MSNVLRCITVWTVDNDGMKEFIEHSKRITFLPGVGLPGRAWSQKKICYIKDLAADTNFPRAVSAKKVNLHSAFAFPIFFDNEVLAVLDFLSQSVTSLDEGMMKLFNDINKQIGIFIAREQTNKKMTMLSRQAGMSEIATSVLHNVGNILNSINISIASILKLTTHKHIKNLVKACKMIHDNLTKQPDYLVNDDKGKLIPDYLVNLSDVLATDYTEIKNETNNLMKHIEHVKDIVVMQKDISGIYGIQQNVFLPEALDFALEMSCVAPETHGIKIVRNYNDAAFIIIDKTKLLQIIVNLIRNAKDSLQLMENKTQKTITLSIKKSNSMIKIIVQDNGVGIPKEIIKKIFTMGFTTKLDGHGFGLHSSAIVAKELGGNLMADSLGAGKGATFTLILPENSAEKMVSTDSKG